MSTTNTYIFVQTEINDSKKNQRQVYGGHVITASFPAELIKRLKVRIQITLRPDVTCMFTTSGRRGLQLNEKKKKR